MIDLRTPFQRLGYDRTPAQAANRARNLLTDRSRDARWQAVREEVWQMVAPLIDAHSRVAIVGAGHGHDLPLRRLAESAAEVVLVDVDGRALRHARRRARRSLRSRVTTITHDITAGAADTIVAAATAGRLAELPELDRSPLPGAPYDLVIGDLFYSQLLYPGLRDTRTGPAVRRAVLEGLAPPLIGAVVARLHASAPGKPVLHLHDPLGWWEGHDQPASAAEILRLAEDDPAAALDAVADGAGPRESDPRPALDQAGASIRDSRLWVWPFDDEVTYLVCATLAGPAPLPAGVSASAPDRRGERGPAQHRAPGPTPGR